MPSRGRNSHGPGNTLVKSKERANCARPFAVARARTSRVWGISRAFRRGSAADAIGIGPAGTMGLGTRGRNVTLGEIARSIAGAERLRTNAGPTLNVGVRNLWAPLDLIRNKLRPVAKSDVIVHFLLGFKSTMSSARERPLTYVMGHAGTLRIELLTV